MDTQTSYSDKLRNPKWQRKRLEIFERDGFTCTQCGDDKNELQVHHKIYIPDIQPWEYPNDVLITLCKKCHDKEFVRWKYEVYLLHTLKAKGFSSFEILSLSCFIEKYNGFRNDVKKLITNAIELGL